MDTVISKNKSLAIKFIAALFIVLTHIFPKVGESNKLKYISLFTLNGYPIEQYIGCVGGICVVMFTFLSGYGMYISYGKKEVKFKEILKKILKLYINYWVILIIFIPIGGWLGVYQINIKEIILNITAIDTSYNHPAWFIRLYLLLMLFYPIIIKCINIYNKNLIIFMSFIITIFGMALTKLYYTLGINNIFIDLISIFLGGQFSFVLGIIIAKYALFNKVQERIQFKKSYYFIMFIAIIIFMAITLNIPVIGELVKLIVTPVFIFIMSNIMSENTFISKLGKHSTNIWLMHAFFYDYLFSDFIFFPRYSIIIILQLTILLILLSIIINKIISIIDKSLISYNVKVKGYTNV